MAKTIKQSLLNQRSFSNSRKLPRVVVKNGNRYRWVGIGWVNEGKATGKETKVVRG
jgi:hypothetical protein